MKTFDQLDTLVILHFATGVYNGNQGPKIGGLGIYTVSQKKTGSFSFHCNYRKYSPILIILSLLQTEIICPHGNNVTVTSNDEKAYVLGNYFSQIFTKETKDIYDTSKIINRHSSPNPVNFYFDTDNILDKLTHLNIYKYRA